MIVGDAAMVELMDYSERRMRAAIRAAPNGVYTGEDCIDDDGIGEEPVVLFRNAASGDLSVVYRREDGNIGWIDGQGGRR